MVQKVAFMAKSRIRLISWVLLCSASGVILSSKLDPMDRQVWIDSALIGAVIGYIVATFFSRS